MSENGPREGTRDLPRHNREVGHRAVDGAGSAGVAYGRLSRSLRRRRTELVALLEAGEVTATLAQSYEAHHPLESPVAAYEIEAALAEARVRCPRRRGRP